MQPGFVVCSRQSPALVDGVVPCGAIASASSLPAGILKLFFVVETKTPEFWLERRL